MILSGDDFVAERNKGKSLLSVTEDYTLVDLETTGLSAQYNNIIEVGCIKFRGGIEVARYQSLVKSPEPIPYIIECITGIHNEDIQQAPTFEDIGMELWDFLKDEIIVGHNVNFDINFLYDNFQRAFNLQFKNDFIDTLRLARLLLPNIREQGYSGHDLISLCNYFGVEFELEGNYENEIDKLAASFTINAFPQFRHHRAIADCQMTNKIFCHFKEMIIRNNFDLADLAKRKYDYRQLKNLQSDGANFDTEHIFFNKCCVFTGKLERFTRIEAAQIVVNIGGRCEDRITKQTNFLIVGDMDYKKGLEGYESSKLRKARQLIANKQDLQILPESAFYDLVSDYLNDT